MKSTSIRVGARNNGILQGSTRKVSRGSDDTNVILVDRHAVKNTAAPSVVAHLGQGKPTACFKTHSVFSHTMGQRISTAGDSRRDCFRSLSKGLLSS